MFRFLNRNIRKRLYPDSRTGQVALLLILAIAILLIFYAVALNLGRISQIKTQVTIASNMSAALMASAMASTAEGQYQVQMGGPSGGDGGVSDDGAGTDLTMCGMSKGFEVFMQFLIMVICSWIAAHTGPAGQAVFTAGEKIVVAISLTLGVLTIIMTVLVNEPGMDDMWNKMIADLPTPADQFVERGIIVALQNSIDDKVEVIDNDDIDMDGITSDKASRFSYFLSKRLRGKFERRNLVVDRELVKAFKRKLGNLVYEPYVYMGEENPPVEHVESDGFGLWDPVSMTCDGQNPHACCGNNPPSPECNQCCQPPRTRPCCCDGTCNPPEPSCGSMANCGSIYQDYPYIYNSEYENPDNGFTSFQEFFGRDDETPYYKKDPAHPSGPQIPDTHSPPLHLRHDDMKGIFFKTLWDVTRRASLNVGGNDFYHWVDFCFWAETEYSFSGQRPCDTMYPTEGHLELRWTCTDVRPPLCNIPINLDKITNAQHIKRANTECPPGGPDPWWKAGDIKYCTLASGAWPYDALCPRKECNCSPACTEEGPCAIYPEGCERVPEGPDEPRTYRVLWSEDDVDLFRNNLSSFASWAGYLSEQDIDALVYSFGSWYNGLLSWIRQDPGNEGELTPYVKPGGNIQAWIDSLSTWAGGRYPAGPGDCGTECYPNSGCTGAPPNPDTTINGIANCHDTKAVQHDAVAQNYLNCYNNCNSHNSNCSGLQACGVYYDPGSPEVPCTEPKRQCVYQYYQGEENDVDIHHFRANFLRTTLANISSITGTLGSARDRIWAFITSPEMAQLAAEWNRMHDAAMQKNADMAPYAIYAWRSDPPDKPRPPPFTGKGYWHIVQVEARLPTRCQNKCGRITQGTSEPGWPWIKSYHKNWYARKCFTLGDSFDFYGDGITHNNACKSVGQYHDHDHARKCFAGGLVKSRVIRYDEDKDALLTFANNVPIWRFITHHAARGGVTPDLINELEVKCPGAVDGAFMINDAAESRDMAQCYNVIRQFLYRGVMSQTCAEYFFHQKYRYGFYPKFTKCPPGEF